MSLEPKRMIVVGCGNMGSSHARSYASLPGFKLVGLVDSDPARSAALSRELGHIPTFQEPEVAIKEMRPDGVAICTYPDTHARLCKLALENNAHVFVEKPVATNVEDARSILKFAQQAKRKVVVGYILRQHPAWTRFIEIAQSLGKPLVMRMNLNQQSSGKNWETHKNLLKAMSPIVDCGVHYVDVMCQMTRSMPVSVQAVGARLSPEIPENVFNYGHLHVRFADSSVGWYEAGWGPMMSEEAFFVKDVVGPKGSVSIVKKSEGAGKSESADIDSHTKTNCLKVHWADLDAQGNPAKKDEFIDTNDEPTHQELCNREQMFLLKAIQEDLDLTAHWEDAVNSLRIVLAADESCRTGKVVNFN